MQTLVQEYLLTHSLVDLAAAHGVYASVSKSGVKMSLNYDQIESKNSDPLASQCRGLILARVDGGQIAKDVVLGETRVVARAFDRFFNYGEGVAEIIDLAHPESVVFEKLDGSICLLHHDGAGWHVATRSVPEADVTIDGFGEHTFRTLFEKALADSHATSFAEFTSALNPEFTYIYELTTPLNRILVKYDVCRLHWLGVRHTPTGQEFCPEVYMGAHGGFARVGVAESHSIHRMEDLLNMVGTKDPTASEGVVVRGPLRGTSFPRIKVKNPAYVAASRIRQSAMGSPRSLLEVILLGKDDDVFPLIPEHLQKIGLEFKTRFAEMSANYDRLYAEFMADASKEENVRKALALRVQKEKLWIPPFMSRFSGQCDSFRGYVDNARKDGTWGDSFLDNLMGQWSEVKS